MTSTIIFFVITLINVVLSTIKSILTVKASKGTAALINAISYGFYAVVVKQMASVSTTTVVTATVLCNLIGVYFSMWLLDKFKTDVTWKISVVPKNNEVAEKIKKDLEKTEMGYNEFNIVTKYGESIALDIFSKTSEESHQVKKILKKHDEIKYHIIELNKNL